MISLVTTPLVGFWSPTTLEERRSHRSGVYRTPVVALSGFLTLSALCSPPVRPALFRAGNVHGVSPSERFPLKEPYRLSAAVALLTLTLLLHCRTNLPLRAKRAKTRCTLPRAISHAGQSSPSHFRPLQPRSAPTADLRAGPKPTRRLRCHGTCPRRYLVRLVSRSPPGNRWPRHRLAVRSRTRVSRPRPRVTAATKRTPQRKALFSPAFIRHRSTERGVQRGPGRSTRPRQVCPSIPGAEAHLMVWLHRRTVGRRRRCSSGISRAEARPRRSSTAPRQSVDIDNSGAFSPWAETHCPMTPQPSTPRVTLQALASRLPSAEAPSWPVAVAAPPVGRSG